MKKFLKVTMFIGLLAISLCGCSSETVETNLPNEALNSTSENVKVVSKVITMNEKSGDDYLTQVTNNEGGTLYSIIQNDFEPDLVLGDNYFATQIADIMLNFDSYVGKTIDIEGFSLDNGYTFVGRYSESDICPDCPTGYAYLEYEWHGNEKLELGTEKNWIKVKGELKKGNDGVEYYYVDAYSIEVMDEWGTVSTVKN